MGTRAGIRINPGTLAGLQSRMQMPNHSFDSEARAFVSGNDAGQIRHILGGVIGRAVHIPGKTGRACCGAMRSITCPVDFRAQTSKCRSAACAYGGPLRDVGRREVGASAPIAAEIELPGQRSAERNLVGVAADLDER